MSDLDKIIYIVLPGIERWRAVPPVVVKEPPRLLRCTPPEGKGKKRPKRQGRNERCNCGSLKKFKDCCYLNEPTS